MQILVVGIGNIWASDDGIGPKIVQRMKAEYIARQRSRAEQHQRTAPTVKFETLSQPAVELLDLMEQRDVLILVDAVSSGAPPGTIHREVRQPGLLNARGVERTSTHGLGVRELLELGTRLGQLPDRVILWGIEIASTKPGKELSPVVEAALPAIVDRFWEELASGFLSLTIAEGTA